MLNLYIQPTIGAYIASCQIFIYFMEPTMVNFLAFYRPLSLAIFLILHFSFTLPLSLQSSPVVKSFSAKLIHRDSPNSPLYKPHENDTQRHLNALRRSSNHLRRFFPDDFVSPKIDAAISEVITAPPGEFLMSISFGTPPFQTYAILDTGSVLVWIQCAPCTHCYKQDSPVFKPHSSYTYKTLRCSAPQCKAAGASCSRPNDVCKYNYGYLDSSYTNGDLATDTIRLDSGMGFPDVIPNILFGCAHNSSGPLYSSKTAGVIGLGISPFSLIAQIGPSIGDKFSYCLVLDRSKETGKIVFGRNPFFSSNEGVQTTPYISREGYPFYFLTLDSISVGNQRLKFSGSFFGTTEGNIFIDSGTTFTFLPRGYLELLKSYVDKIVNRPDLKAKDPFGFLDPCYRNVPDLKLPLLTAHFRGADVVLYAKNAFTLRTEDIVCLAFRASDEDYAIFGNIAQYNLFVEYDLNGRTVSFKPADCNNI